MAPQAMSVIAAFVSTQWGLGLFSGWLVGFVFNNRRNLLHVWFQTLPKYLTRKNNVPLQLSVNR